MIILKNNIREDRIFRSKNTYIIWGEIRVLNKVKLCIEDGVQIYLVNGPMRSSLIFNTGSILQAESFTVRACNRKFKPVKKANNAGVWFLGSSSNASKDEIDVEFSTKTSSFNCKRLTTYFCGRSDPSNGDNQPGTDDIDGISVLGVGDNEWNIREIVSFGSGDDGFDVTNSSITVEHICIYNPTEDGLNITSSRLNITKSLYIIMLKSAVMDRDLFDQETDDGPSYIRLAKGCKVDIRGFFGDQLTLVSKDLPQPTEKYYKFNGYSSKGQTYIYSGALPDCKYTCGSDS